VTPLFASSPEELVVLDYLLEHHPREEGSIYWWDVRTKTRVSWDSVDTYLEIMLWWKIDDRAPCYRVALPAPDFDKPDEWVKVVEILEDRSASGRHRDAVTLHSLLSPRKIRCRMEP
jgi:hypothetical protein